MNNRVNVPILSWIYKEMARENLTPWNVVILLIAIPASIYHRLIFNGKFPTAAAAIFGPGGVDSVLSPIIIQSRPAALAAMTSATTSSATNIGSTPVQKSTASHQALHRQPRLNSQRKQTQ